MASFIGCFADRSLYCRTL